MVAPAPEGIVPLGRVVDAYGLKGWVKVEPFAGTGEGALTGAPRWRLLRGPSPAHPPIDRWVGVSGARAHGASVVAKPAGCEDREAALALKGAEVGVHRADFPRLPEGEFYWIDLIGCAVSNPAGEVLGKVVSVDDHGAHPILQTDAGLLIPFVDAYVVEVEPEQGRIVVDWQADWAQ